MVDVCNESGHYSDSCKTYANYEYLNPRLMVPSQAKCILLRLCFHHTYTNCVVYQRNQALSHHFGKYAKIAIIPIIPQYLCAIVRVAVVKNNHNTSETLLTDNCKQSDTYATMHWFMSFFVSEGKSTSIAVATSGRWPKTIWSLPNHTGRQTVRHADRQGGG